MNEARPLPQNVLLEEQLLGMILASPDAFRATVSTTRPEHFSSAVNAMLYSTIVAQADAGRGFDVNGLMSALRLVWRDKVTEDQTVGQYVAALLADAGPPTFALRAAQDLRDLWAMREILAAAERPAFEDGIPVRDQLTEVFEAVDTVRAGLLDGVGGRVDAGNLAARTVERVRAAVEDGEVTETGATTGFIDVDRMMLGYRPGELVIVAARPGMGKTTFATSSLLQSARAGHGMALFSLELPEEPIMARLLADTAYDGRFPLSHSAIRSNQVSRHDLGRLNAAAQSVGSLPLVLDFSPRLSIPEINVRVGAIRKEMAAQGRGLKAIAIDYLKFVKASDRYRGQRVYEVGEITSGLKEIAKQHELCVVLLAQLNRGVEGQNDKRPDLQHLRESGDIESDADVVMFLYRDAYYIEKSPGYRAGEVDALSDYAAARNKLEVVIAKNRNGACGTVTLYCDIAASAIRNADRIAFGEAA